MKQEKSFVKQAYEKFQQNEDMRGLMCIKDGVEHYTDQLLQIANAAETEDVGLLTFAMKAVAESLRKGIPAAEETEKLASAMLSAVIVTMPTAADEREEES